MEAIGANGRISVEGSNVIISRKGTGFITRINQGLQGDKVIPLHQITAVQMKEPGFARGYLRLSMNGRDPVGGLFEAVTDENAVLFEKKHLAAFKEIRDLIQTKMGTHQTAPGLSAADEIEKLGRLCEAGCLLKRNSQQRSVSFLVFEKFARWASEQRAEIPFVGLVCNI
jgi:hypothetical protein